MRRLSFQNFILVIRAMRKGTGSWKGVMKMGNKKGPASKERYPTSMRLVGFLLMLCSPFPHCQQGSSVKINMQEAPTTSLDDEGGEQPSPTGRDKREEEREAALLLDSNFVTSSKVARGEEGHQEVTPSVGRKAGDREKEEEMLDLEEAEVGLASELDQTVAAVATGEQDVVEVSAESMEVEGEVTLGEGRVRKRGKQWWKEWWSAWR